MEHVEYVYTAGMTDAEVEDHFRAGEHGVLSLASDDDAYAVPLSYHYDGERLLLRVSHHDGSKKRQYIETTDTATFLCFDASAASSWSIQVRGPLAPWDEDVDEAAIDEWFPPFRLFDETVDEVEFTLYELRMESVVGRQTVE